MTHTTYHIKNYHEIPSTRVLAKSLQSYLTLYDLMDCSPPGSCVYVHSVDILNKDAGELLGASLATSTSLGQILLTLLIASGEYWKRNCRAGRHCCHPANQVYIQPMGVIFPQPTALRWFQAAGALPEPCVTWLCTSAISYSKQGLPCSFLISVQNIPFLLRKYC